MEIAIKFINEAGEETSESLPGKHEVCGRCEGHGTHLNPSIGEHAYTAEEFAESFDDDGREEYFRHGGIYDTTCEECDGKRVVAVIDEDACRSAEQIALLACYRLAERDRLESEREDRETMRGECGGYW